MTEPAQTVPDAGEMLAALPVATLLIDPAGTVRDANAAAEALCNRSRAAMTGRTVGELIPLPAGLAHRSDRRLSAYDVEIGSGPRRTRADVAEAPVAGEGGWSVMTLHPRALPARAGLAEGVGASPAAIGVAAILAHEIRNPLSGIRGAAQLLAQDANADGRALTGLITREVDRIAALIDGMQRFGDARPPALAAASVFPMLAHARAVAAAGFAAHAHIVEDYDPSLPDALVEHDAFVQVMMNLLKNAAEATEQVANASIRIGVAFRPGMVLPADDGRPRRSLPIEVTVTDNGPGAPPAITAHLFDPFVSGRRQGQGLGLTLVDKLVRDMGGVVQYAREGDPAHTVFRLRLQRAPT